MTNWGILQALAFEPRKAFAEIRERPSYAFPLLLVVAGSMIIAFWYRSVVDLEWLTDSVMRSNETIRRALTDEQITARAQAAGENPGAAIALGALGTGLGVLLGYLISGAYFTLAGKITGLKYSFRQWFALSCWTALPTLLTLLAAAFVLMGVTSPQILPDAIQPLSLNALYFQRKLGESGYTLYTNLSLPMLLSMILALLAVKDWSRRSWLFSVIFTFLPTALVVGIAALVIARNS